MSAEPPLPRVPRIPRTDRRVQITPARISLTITIIILALASGMFRLLMWQRLEHTALVFIGIPAALASGRFVSSLLFDISPRSPEWNQRFCQASTVASSLLR